MNIKEDTTVLKSSKIYFKTHIPYRYVLRYLPMQYPATPYAAYRENMKMIDGVWQPITRYWASLKTNAKDAEKEYLKKIESEGPHG